VPVECEVEKPFRFNNRFYATKGKEWFVDGQFRFPPVVERNKFAVEAGTRFIYGYCFAHTGIIYANSDQNFNLASRRLLCVREPENPGEDEDLRRRNRAFVRRWRDEMLQCYWRSAGRVHWTHDMRLAAIALAALPHAKRKLREAEMKERIDAGTIAEETWVRSVNWKLKLCEIAKPGKYPRVIVDLGVGASMQGADFASVCKKHMGVEHIILGDTEFIFCKEPSPEVVVELFKRLWSTPYKRCIVCFSDDGMGSVMTPEGRRYFCSDVNTNDASHVESQFDLTFDLFDAPEDVRKALIGQIMSPLVIRSVDKRYSVRLKPREYYLQSGITLTTLVNNVAQLCIAMAYEKADAVTEAEFIQAARGCGYIITLEMCEREEDLQFLKMSPCRDKDGEWRALLNLGVILRASGVSKEQLPGRGALKPRAMQFQHNLMCGLLASIDYPPLAHLDPMPGSERTYVPTGVSTLMDLNNGTIGVVKRSYDRGDFYNRYRLTPEEIYEFEELLSHSGYGIVHYSSAAYKIIEKDYGLGLKPSDR
jgi:hypothetical protein